MSSNPPSTRELFAAALQLPEHKRAAFVAESASSPEMRREVLDLLAALGRAGDYLNSPTADTIPPAPAPHGAIPLDPSSTPRIGPYKLLQLIGEGGFGQVFMAEQEHPVRRRVALKIIKLGMDTRQVIARFEAERQALALMDHPNIAKVFDAGSTESGRPYFVMELVRGDPVTSYADRESLSTADRLELFSKVCLAVHHAHSKGVIHRDIKPSNVLVTVADGKPIPKVIDFGIAKATSARLTDRTLFTEHRSIIGTLEYMSPEQADTSGVDADTRSDVYSLGVLLYELLTGVTPLDAERLRSAAIGEVQRILREEDPPKPSTRLHTMRASALNPAPVSETHSASDIARRRRTDPQSLVRALKGDLDWIVMKALDKDRNRRYSTPEAFAEDIGRFLADRPVLATPPSATYTLGKLVRRNRTACIAAVCVSLALFLGAAAWVNGLVRAKASAEEAARQSALAQSINDFLIDDLLKAVKPAAEGQRGRGRDTKLRDVLDEAASRLATAETTRLADQPLTVANLRRVIGEIYASLGEYEQAASHLKSAAAYLDANPLAAPQTMLAASITLADALGELDRYDEARPLSQKTLERCLATLGESHPITFRSKESLSEIEVFFGNFDLAKSLAKEAFDGQNTLYGPTHTRTLTAQAHYASVLRRAGFPAEATALLSDAYQKCRESLGETAPASLACAGRLARLYEDTGNLSASRKLIEETLAIKQRVYGKDHPDTVWTEAELGTLLIDLGRFDEALRTLERCYEVQKNALGADHYDAVRTRSNIARTYLMRGEPANADTILLEIQNTLEAKYGSDHPDVISVRWQRASSLFQQRKFVEAEASSAQVLAASERLYGADHPKTLNVRADYATIILELGRTDEAIKLLEQCLASAVKIYGPDHPDAVRSKVNLGAAYAQAGNQQRAADLFREALVSREKVLGPDHPDTSTTRLNLGVTLFELGDKQGAFRTCEQALAAVLINPGPRSSITEQVARYVMEVYEKAERPELAASVKSRVQIARLEVNVAKPDASTTDIARLARLLASCEPPSLRNPSRALELANRAIAGAPADPVALFALSVARDANADPAGALEAALAAAGTEGIPPELKAAIDAHLSKLRTPK